MDLYTDVTMELSRRVTERYSTSFSSSSTLFGADIRPYIYAVYGLVRIADEIVDTYRGPDMVEQLDELEQTTYQAIETGYSANPIVHSFAVTARKYSIERDVIAAFFTSMRMDTTEYKNTKANYQRYIYGSAEAVGLMCLRVFVDGNEKTYEQLRPGAQALGAAYQKINFLRDLASDSSELERWYFPASSYANFDNKVKAAICEDIRHDISLAKAALVKLPPSSQKAVALSLAYYGRLLDKLERTDAAQLKQRRIRVSNWVKTWLYFRAKVGL